MTLPAGGKKDRAVTAGCSYTEQENVVISLLYINSLMNNATRVEDQMREVTLHKALRPYLDSGLSDFGCSDV